MGLKVLLSWMRQLSDTSAQWLKYASSLGPLARRMSEASVYIKPELRLIHFLGCFERNWFWPHMKHADHVASDTPYVGACEYAAPGKLRRLLS